MGTGYKKQQQEDKRRHIICRQWCPEGGDGRAGVGGRERGLALCQENAAAKM